MLDQIEIQIPYGRLFAGLHKLDEYLILTNTASEPVVLDGCSVQRQTSRGRVLFSFDLPSGPSIASYDNPELLLLPEQSIFLVTAELESFYGFLRYERDRSSLKYFVLSLGQSGHVWDSDRDYVAVVNAAGKTISRLSIGAEKARQYELFVKSILVNMRTLLPKGEAEVSHRKTFVGRSGQSYQIDISLEFNLLGIKYITLVECKCYRHPVAVGELLEFSSKIEDIGAHKGIMIATSRFQQGCFTVARSKGIALVVTDEQSSADFDINLGARPTPKTEDYVFGARWSDAEARPVMGVIKCKNWSRQHLSSWEFYDREIYSQFYRGLQQVVDDIRESLGKTARIT